MGKKISSKARPFRDGDVVDLGSGVYWTLTRKTAASLNRRPRHTRTGEPW